MISLFQFSLQYKECFCLLVKMSYVKHHYLLYRSPHLTLDIPGGREIQRHSIYIQHVLHKSILTNQSVNNPLTTPISPWSVSVCLTVTWITGLGLFPTNKVMATLSGTVLLFLR